MENTQPTEPLILGVDYTIEDGRWVFTAHFLTKRGYCCESGCRHCPYGFEQKLQRPGAVEPGHSCAD